MQSDQLSTKQVLASGDTVWQSEGDLALVGDEAVDSPLATAVQTILPNLFRCKLVYQGFH